jgi:hypothetical protein
MPSAHHVRIETTDGRLIAGRCRVARTPWARARGLLARGAAAREAGLLLRGCRSVHTVGMTAPIAVVFLDDGGRVLRVVDRLQPWRAASCRGAGQVLELAAGGTAPGALAQGDVLCMTPPSPR